MATHLKVATSADQATVIDAFQESFFSRPSLTERLFAFTPTRAQRKFLTWEPTSYDGAVVAAQVVRATGAREAMARKSGRSQVGVTFALAFEPSRNGNVVQIWLARGHDAFLGFGNAESDILKVYVKNLSRRLNAAGHQASVAKV